MPEVPYGQDPYSVIGKYIRDHITAIEDIIAVIEIDDITTNQLFMVDMNEENCFIWDNDWYEGEKNVALIDFFPVSEAINPSTQPEQQWIPCSERLPDHEVLCCDTHGEYIIGYPYADKEANTGFSAESDSIYLLDCVAWMPLPKPYKGGDSPCTT